MGSLNWVRALYTVGCFLAFVMILLYAYSRHNKKIYEDEAQSIIDDPDTPSDQINHQD